MSKKDEQPMMSAWIELHRANRFLINKVEAELKKNNLPSLDWYDVLLELSRDIKNGLRQYEIGEKVLLNKHNLSRLLDRLEKHDLLARYVCEEDGRGNRIKLTADGEKTLKAMWPIYRKTMQECFGNKLSNNELAKLAQTLSKINN